MILTKDLLSDYIKKWGEGTINIPALWSTLSKDGFTDYDKFVSLMESMDGREVVVTQRDNMGSPISIRSNMQRNPVSPSSPSGYEQSYHDNSAGQSDNYWNNQNYSSGGSVPGPVTDVKCPKCNGGAYVSDEEVVKVLENVEPVKVVLRITYICRSCGERFTRVVVENVDAKRKEKTTEDTKAPGFPTSLESLRPGMSTTGRTVDPVADRLTFLDKI